MKSVKTSRIMMAAAALIALTTASFLPTLPAANAQAPLAGVQMFAKKGAEKHPEIRRAIANLEKAQNNLQKAAHDFAGHREKALDLTQQAIKECQAALAADKT